MSENLESIKMSRKRLTFKVKSLILEESSKPNFDKAKICKDFGIRFVKPLQDFRRKRVNFIKE